MEIVISNSKIDIKKIRKIRRCILILSALSVMAPFFSNGKWVTFFGCFFFSSMCVYLFLLGIGIFWVDQITFLDENLEINGYTGEGNASIKTSIPYSHFQKIFFDSNRILTLFTGSDRFVLKVCLKDYSNDKINKILQQFLCVRKEVSISSQLFGIYSIDDKITYKRDESDNIIKKFRICFPPNDLTGALFCGVFGLGGFINKINERITGIFCVAYIILWIRWYFYASSSKIIIKKDNFIFKPLKVWGNEQIILWNEISKAVLAFDKNLILYNKDGDQDRTLDLSSFPHDDIQIFLNTLSEKTQIELEPELQKNEKFLIYNQNAQSVSTPSRRRVVAGEKTNPQQNVAKEENVAHKRSLELEDTTQPQETHKRNLEL